MGADARTATGERNGCGDVAAASPHDGEARAQGTAAMGAGAGADAGAPAPLAGGRACCAASSAASNCSSREREIRPAKRRDEPVGSVVVMGKPLWAVPLRTSAMRCGLSASLKQRTGDAITLLALRRPKASEEAPAPSSIGTPCPQTTIATRRGEPSG